MLIIEDTYKQGEVLSVDRKGIHISSGAFCVEEKYFLEKEVLNERSILM